LVLFPQPVCFAKGGLSIYKEKQSRRDDLNLGVAALALALNGIATSILVPLLFKLLNLF